MTDSYAGKTGGDSHRVDQQAAADLGAQAVVGVDLDYEVIREGMLMVTASGTAVSVR